MLSEFSLIDHFFARRARAHTHHYAALGIGDDCALITPPVSEMFAVSTDTLVEGHHFLVDVDPHALGHKALAVNLSDLAAMGAKPLAFMLSVTLPVARQEWLEAFSVGICELAERFDCELIGGDTTAGPLNICITVFGSVPLHLALRRDIAQPGDDIWISGTLGDARAYLGMLRGEWTIQVNDTAVLQCALERPEPRIELGIALRGIARSAIDISDGLAGDLLHILKCSRVNAIVNIDAIPRSPMLNQLTLEVQRHCVLAGGDDYELCFTAAASSRHAVDEIARRVDVPITRIGIIVPSKKKDATITWRDVAGKTLSLPLQHGFDHFNAD